MEHTNLSQRLRTVASFVPTGARLADIGSDHAYLPLFLVENDQIVLAIAGEVVNGPYQSALSNVAAAGKSDQILVRKGNGLSVIEAEDAISLITIAGMGGRLIADILEAGLDKLESVERLILQPNNREDELREWLENHDFQIVAESILTENQKFYEVLVVEKGQEKLSSLDRRFGPFLRQEKSAVFQEKWLREQGKLAQALEKIPEEHQADRQLLADRIQAIKEVLDAS